MMNPKRGGPIFLVGTGRCGSTIIYSSLAMHPELSWISSWVSAFPGFPQLAVLSRFWSLPGTGRLWDTRFFPNPVEPLQLFPHWLEHYRSEVVGEEMMEEGRRKLLPLVNTIVRYHGRRRFVGKLVGRPVKVELLAQLFPDAVFLHVTRDFKPTVCSLMQVGFYDVASGLDLWQWEKIPDLYRDHYERSGRAPEIAAGIKVRLNILELDRQLGRLSGDRWFEVPYADFVRSPVEQVRLIGTRIGLPLDDSFIRRVQGRRIYGGADKKWMKYFSETQIRQLEGLEFLPAIEQEA